MVAESLHPELEARDSDCLIVETQLETQARDEPNLSGTDCSPAHLKNMTVPGIHQKYMCSHQFCGCPVSEADLSEGRTMCMNCSDQSWEEGTPRDCDHCVSGCSFCDWQDEHHGMERRVSHAMRNWGRFVYSMLLMCLDVAYAAPCPISKPNSSVSWADPLITVWPQTAVEPSSDSDLQSVCSLELSQSLNVTNSITKDMSDEKVNMNPSSSDLVMVSAGSVKASNEFLSKMSRGPGEPWLSDTAVADSLSLRQRVKEAFAVVPESDPEHLGSSASCDWFHGKMSTEWFQKHMIDIDHSDDRFRRDWSTKESESKKGPNRFAKQWAEYMDGRCYTDPDDLPYSPACEFGKNLSQDCDFERQRLLMLSYCEFLKCYAEVWTKIHSRHPVAGVLFSGAGIMVRGFLWMGVRCIMVDHDAQKDAPVGDDCLFVRADVKELDVDQLNVDWIQASPPCPPSSTAPNMGGVACKSKHEQLIPFFQDMMCKLNENRSKLGMDDMLYVLENVASSGHLMKLSMLTDGQQVGSRVNRKRMLESNCELNCELSHDLKVCLGSRAKWPRTDKNLIAGFMKRASGEAGVSENACPDYHLAPPCCQGTTWSAVGSQASHTGNRWIWTRAMGVESGMSRVSIVNGLHSGQGALIAGLMMRCLSVRLGVPFVPFDEVLRDPSWMNRIRCFDEQLFPKKLSIHGSVHLLVDRSVYVVRTAQKGSYQGFPYHRSRDKDVKEQHSAKTARI